MEFFDTSKSIAENVNLLADPITAILAFLIFDQIRIARKSLALSESQLEEARKQLVVSSKRDAIKLAAEQTKYYAENIIPKIDKISNPDIKVMKQTAPPLSRNFTRSELKHYLQGKTVENYWKNGDDTIAELGIANALEVFATPFIEGVADENVAFKSVGTSFCFVVPSMAVLYCIFRNEEPLLYENTIKLYQLWMDRFDSFKQDKAIVEIEKKLSEARSARKSDSPPIRPIGT